jgi:uncharacterized membrane protein YcaP (DUF421 family)
MVLIESASLGLHSPLHALQVSDCPAFHRCATRALVREGKLLRKTLRREFVTAEALNAKIVQKDGVEDVATGKQMYLETDGAMSLIRQHGAKAGA